MFIFSRVRRSSSAYIVALNLITVKCKLVCCCKFFVDLWRRRGNKMCQNELLILFRYWPGFGLFPVLFYFIFSVSENKEVSICSTFASYNQLHFILLFILISYYFMLFSFFISLFIVVYACLVSLSCSRVCGLLCRILFLKVGHHRQRYKDEDWRRRRWSSLGSVWVWQSFTISCHSRPGLITYLFSAKAWNILYLFCPVMKWVTGMILMFDSYMRENVVSNFLAVFNIEGLGILVRAYTWKFWICRGWGVIDGWVGFPASYRPSCLCSCENPESNFPHQWILAKEIYPRKLQRIREISVLVLKSLMSHWKAHRTEEISSTLTIISLTLSSFPLSLG